MIDWDVEAAIGRLGEIAVAIDASMLARAAAAGLVRGTQEAAPVLTGTLRRSIRINGSSGGGGKGSATYGPHVVYARIQNQGGTIRVKRAKVLTNHIVFFGKQVTLKGQDYMGRGAETGADYAYQRVAQAVSRAMEG